MVVPLSRAVASMGEEKVEFMQHYFCNEAFRNFVNGRVFASCQRQEAVRSKKPTRVLTSSRPQTLARIPAAVVDEGQELHLHAAENKIDSWS